MAIGDDLLVFLYDDKGTPYGMFTVLDGVQQYFFYLYNAQGDVIAIIDDYAERVVNYEYSAWGELLSVTGSKADTVGVLNPFRYRGYCYDTETGLYYVSSRYYDPEIGRFISADDTEYLGADGSVLSCNLFAYCMNNPVNRFDVDGNWSLPNWAKVAIGAVATVAAVAVTVATGGAADGFMTGGLCALGGSVIGGATRTIKNARSGITIGKVGQFEDVAEIAKVRHYSGLKEFKLIEKTLGTKAAETVGWWQNKCVVKGVMALKGSIYDCGGALTGAYAKEVALTKGYQYLYNVWLM